MVMQIKRTATASNPPPALAEGQLAVGMADNPPTLWVGVPTSLSSNGRKQVNPPPTLRMSIRVFTASGPYTPPAGLQWAVVECCGGGGGGGGAFGPSSGGGGSSGSYSRTVLSAAQIGASQTVTVGAGGPGSTGASGSTTPGTAGGTTSFGTLCTANGGAGGTQTTGSSPGGAGTAAGSATGALAVGGAAGGAGISTANLAIGGCGASSFFGGGALSPVVGTQGSGGFNANAPGAGGSGGCAVQTGWASTGGNGSAGVCIVTEYSF